jgi:predicted nucleic acid-binding protein
MILIDTNVVAYFFSGNKNAGSIIAHNEIAISINTYIEILSNKNLNKLERSIVNEFLNSNFLCYTNAEIAELAISIGLSYNIKPMDAIIIATAKYLNIGLATADKKLFKIKEIPIIELIIESNV